MKYNSDILKKYIPENAVEKVIELLNTYQPQIKISRSRTTKLGDYRPPQGNIKIHRISVNHDLNSYAFLVTLLHELAHLVTWQNHKRKAKPHGTEWKNAFKSLLIPFFDMDIFPNDINQVLMQSITNLKASSCTDQNLYKTLRKYDKPSESLLLEDVETNTVFRFRGQDYLKQEKRRTRYLCKHIVTQKKYLINGIAEVNLVDSHSC